jgi:hypothetical protein
LSTVQPALPPVLALDQVPLWQAVAAVLPSSQ